MLGLCFSGLSFIYLPFLLLFVATGLVVLARLFKRRSLEAFFTLMLIWSWLLLGAFYVTFTYLTSGYSCREAEGIELQVITVYGLVLCVSSAVMWWCLKFVPTQVRTVFLWVGRLLIVAGHVFFWVVIFPAF